MTDFELDEKKLIEYFIDTYYLPGAFRTSPNMNWQQGVTIELNVNPYCNQNCEYCYLAKFGSDLFPSGNIRKDIYLKHLDVLLKFLVSKKIWIQRWAIFGGDLFYNEIIFDIFDKLYTNYFNKIPWQDFYHGGPVEIIIPNNLSYIKDDKIFEKVLGYFNKFRANKLVIGFSWSTDGKYCVDTREQKILSDAYWDDMFEKSVKLECGYHPMISASNVSNWIRNYDWWIEMFTKHNVNRYYHYDPAMLEVRNNDWTNEKLEEYLKFLQHLFKCRLDANGNDIQKMAAFSFCGDGRDGSIEHFDNIDPLRTNPFIDKENLEDATCGLQNTLHLDLSDLSLIPCHRTSYNQFRGGKFIVNKDEIIGIFPHNVSTYISICSYSSNLLPKCVNCVWKDVCPHGCIGAQFEDSGELFNPIESVCNLFKCKYTYLIKLYNETGLIQTAIDHNYFSSATKQFYIEKSKLLGYQLNGG